MDPLVWILVPGLIAAGAGVLAFFIMQARMEVALALERAATAEARGALEQQKRSMVDALKAAEELGRRQALDDFLADLRIEQRHYTREHKVLFLHRKILVLEERIFFRNIPLSNWIEHEILLEEGADIDKVARSLSSFEREVLSIDRPQPRRLLR